MENETAKVFEELQKKIEDWNKNHSHPVTRHCPHCGYCPHCGRGGYYQDPRWPYYPTPWTPFYPDYPVVTY